MTDLSPEEQRRIRGEAEMHSRVPLPDCNLDLRKILIAALTEQALSHAREIAMQEEHRKRDLASDSPVASCSCLTKSPDIQYHAVGCKYRLISERDELKRRVESLDFALKIAETERDDREARLGAIEREHSCEGDGCPVCYSLSRLPDEPISHLTGAPKEG